MPEPKTVTLLASNVESLVSYMQRALTAGVELTHAEQDAFIALQARQFQLRRGMDQQPKFRNLAERIANY